MNISRRNIIFIILGLVVVGLLVWWFWYRQQLIQVAVGPQGNDYSNTSTSNTNTQPVDQQPTSPVSMVSNINANLKNVATVFTERYGSYSTDAKFENFKSVESLSTDELVSSLRSMAQDGQNKPVAGFYGVTTKVVAVDVVNQNSGAAEVLVGTQRQESFNREGETKITYQNLKLSLKKQGDNWLVDSAEWAKQ